ncbi:MAG: F0F1 ATP synthase subunit A [Pseudomonadota bacterium]|jgi:F-type H+-transporting ATPase subunit a
MSADTFIFLDHTPLHSAIEKPATVEQFGGLVNNGLEASPIIHAGLASILLIMLAVIVNRSYQKQELAPSFRTFSVRNLMELAVVGLLDFMESLMGSDAKRFLPLIGGTAFFILFNNLMGLIPGFDAATANYNTPLACALVIFIATHIVGIRTHGASYVKQFLGPVWWLAWLMLPIELISHFARILSLSVRLFGNMMGDHRVLAIFLGMVALGIPVIFMGMGIFIALVQTFVFTLLSILYIAFALEEAH